MTTTASSESELSSSELQTLKDDHEQVKIGDQVVFALPKKVDKRPPRKVPKLSSKKLSEIKVPVTVLILHVVTVTLMCSGCMCVSTSMCMYMYAMLLLITMKVKAIQALLCNSGSNGFFAVSPFPRQYSQ